MCLLVKKGEVERTAKEDIVVYKVIKMDNTSLYLGFRYEPNTLYRLGKKWEDKLIINYYGEIHEGFHSYLNYRIAYKLCRYDKIVKFVIPKGAKYYLGINDEIVSTSIRSGNLKHLSWLRYIFGG